MGDSPLPDNHPLDYFSTLFAKRDDPAMAYYVSICIQGVHTDALVRVPADMNSHKKS